MWILMILFLAIVSFLTILHFSWIVLGIFVDPNRSIPLLVSVLGVAVDIYWIGRFMLARAERATGKFRLQLGCWPSRGDCCSCPVLNCSEPTHCCFCTRVSLLDDVKCFVCCCHCPKREDPPCCRCSSARRRCCCCCFECPYSCTCPRRNPLRPARCCEDCDWPSLGCKKDDARACCVWDGCNWKLCHSEFHCNFRAWCRACKKGCKRGDDDSSGCCQCKSCFSWWQCCISDSLVQSWMHSLAGESASRGESWFQKAAHCRHFGDDGSGDCAADSDRRVPLARLRRHSRLLAFLDHHSGN